jgi:hypothetical protein
MKDIFQFNISDDLRSYKENKIYVEVSLLGNNVKYYISELEKLSVSFKKQETQIMRYADVLNKGKFHRRVNLLEENLDNLNIAFDIVIRVICNLLPESKEYIIKEQVWLMKRLKDSKNDFYVGSLQLIEDFYRDLSEQIEAKLIMCQKLKLLENKTLKAIVTFHKEGFDTHFTKYHLNLEGFSDQLHEILQDELEIKYIKSYKALEHKHTTLIEEKEDNNLITLKKFLSFSDEVMKNYSELKKYPSNFLKAQVNTVTIDSDIEGLIGVYSKIEEKFDEIYVRIKDKPKYKDNVNLLYLRLMAMIYESNLADFINFNTESVDNLLEFVKDKEGVEKNLDYFSLSNLIRVEPIIGNKLMKNALAIIKQEGQYHIHNTKEKLMIKKTDKHFFDNNQFYSHEMTMYEMVPNSVSFKKNKYVQNSGYDKVLISEKINRVTDEVYSHILKKNIRYEFYIKVVSYYVNLNNQYQHAS